MAKKNLKEDGVWRTINGRKVFIKEGQSASDAIKEYEDSKTSTKTETKKSETIKNNIDDFLNKNSLTDDDDYDTVSEKMEKLAEKMDEMTDEGTDDDPAFEMLAEKYDELMEKRDQFESGLLDEDNYDSINEEMEQLAAKMDKMTDEGTDEGPEFEQLANRYDELMEKRDQIESELIDDDGGVLKDTALQAYEDGDISYEELRDEYFDGDGEDVGKALDQFGSERAKKELTDPELDQSNPYGDEFDQPYDEEYYEINNDIGGRGFEMEDGSYLNVEYKDGKLYAGSVTNTGMTHDYEIDYDKDESLDANLETLYDQIQESNRLGKENLVSANELNYIDENGYEPLAVKDVVDSDGFTTEYSMYKTPDGKYKMVFGDRDIYGPDSDADMEFDTIEEATEWFDNYKGFEDYEYADDIMYQKDDGSFENAYDAMNDMNQQQAKQFVEDLHEDGALREEDYQKLKKYVGYDTGEKHETKNSLPSNIAKELKERGYEDEEIKKAEEYYKEAVEKKYEDDYLQNADSLAEQLDLDNMHERQLNEYGRQADEAEARYEELKSKLQKGEIEPYSDEDYELMNLNYDKKVREGIMDPEEVEYQKAKLAWQRDEISREEFDKISDRLNKEYFSKKGNNQDQYIKDIKNAKDFNEIRQIAKKIDDEKTRNSVESRLFNLQAHGYDDTERLEYAKQYLEDDYNKMKDGTYKNLGNKFDYKISNNDARYEVSKNDFDKLVDLKKGAFEEPYKKLDNGKYEISQNDFNKLVDSKKGVFEEPYRKIEASTNDIMNNAIREKASKKENYSYHKEPEDKEQEEDLYQEFKEKGKIGQSYSEYKAEKRKSETMNNKIRKGSKKKK